MSDFKHDGIVVLGHPRSGTTLLRRLLNGHENISCPGETHILSACARFLHAEQTADGVEMGVLTGLSFAGFDENEVVDRLRDFALHYLQGYAKKNGTRRWAEKTAVDSFYIGEIEQVFGEHAYFVGIVRHGLDVAISCKDFTEATGVYLENFHPYIRQFLQPLDAFAHSWHDVNTKMLEFSQRHPENCLIIRYEDLVDEPDEILGSVFDFIGEDYSPDIISAGLNNLKDLGLSDHESFKKKTISKVRKSRWSEVPPVQIQHLGNVLNPLLEMCGYDPLVGKAAMSREEARRRYEMSLMVHASKQDSD